MGKGMAEIESPQGFAAETSGMAAILASSHLGFGLSTTHVVSGAIMGTGLARTPDEVRWKTGGRMLTTWGLTLPASGIVGAAAAWLSHLGDPGFLATLVIMVALLVIIKLISTRNHVSHKNVNDSRDIVVLAKQVVSPELAQLPSVLSPELPEPIADHPMANTHLRLTRLKKPKAKKGNQYPPTPRNQAPSTPKDGSNV